ncbi:hypothetical protein MSPP1_003981 [Malassezia sp. CBS 17886]|nr:hypothetical protein MSPP1_003981 [Malassezia sp. CBS 17886]
MAHPLHGPLSARQESRLVLYLDDSMLQIARAFQKRHEPGAALPTLRAYLERWASVVQVASTTPLHGSSASLRDVYLLRVVSELFDGVVGYSLARDTTLARDVQLTLVLYWADVLDQLWAARLHRAELTFHDAQHAAHVKFPLPERADQLPSIFATSTYIQSPMAPPSSISLGDIPPLSTTDSVRLRDVLVDTREQLFAWMRRQFGMEPPPRLQGGAEWVGSGSEGGAAGDTGVDTGVETEVDTGVETEVDTGVETEVDTEIDAKIDTEVDTDLDREPATEAQGRPIDPDADDDDDDENGDVGDGNGDAGDARATDGAPGIPGNAEPPSKRRRRAPTDAEEDHAFWDTHFTSIFSRALRALRT